jgi:hypothetical protein
MRANAFLLSGLLLFGCVGDAEALETLQPLSDAEAELHEAPRADGSCPASQREAAASWSVQLPGHENNPRGAHSLKLQADPCGNILVAFVDPDWDHYPARLISVARLFGNGELDWRRTAPHGINYRVQDLTTDDFGNIVLLTDSRLAVLTAAGAVPPHMSEEGLASGGLAVRPTVGGWLLANGVTGVIGLPFGTIVWKTDGDLFGDWRPSYDGTFVLRAERRVVYSDVAWRNEKSSVWINDVTFNLWGTTGPVAHHEGESLYEFESELFVAPALLAADDSRIVLGLTLSEPQDGGIVGPTTCSQARLIDIADAEWEPELDFCGMLQAMSLLPDGSVLSLWAEDVDGASTETQPEARPLLVRHDAGGTETGRWDLGESVGAAPGRTVGQMDLVVLEGGASVAVAAMGVDLATVTVARLPLD